MNDLLDDPIDPNEKLKKDRELELERNAIRTVLSSRGGRRFIWGLMGKCGLGQNPFTGENNYTNFNAGRQSVATDLLVDMEAVNPDAYLIMHKESKEDKAYVNTGNNPAASEQRPAEQHDSIAAIATGKL